MIFTMSSEKQAFGTSSVRRTTENVTSVRIGMDFSQLGLSKVEQATATAKLGKSHSKLITHPGVCPARL